MGIGTKVVKHEVQKTANKALDEMGAVGDAIDKHTTTGPLDKADDALDKTRDNLSDRKGNEKR